jgi:hypothetical protein
MRFRNPFFKIFDSRFNIKFGDNDNLGILCSYKRIREHSREWSPSTMCIPNKMATLAKNPNSRGTFGFFV